MRAKAEALLGTTRSSRAIKRRALRNCIYYVFDLLFDFAPLPGCEA